MLYAVTHIDYRRDKPFVPLSEEKVRQRYSIRLDGVPFSGLNYRQYNVLRQLAKSSHSSNTSCDQNRQVLVN